MATNKHNWSRKYNLNTALSSKLLVKLFQLLDVVDVLRTSLQSKEEAKECDHEDDF